MKTSYIKIDKEDVKDFIERFRKKVSYLWYFNRVEDYYRIIFASDDKGAIKCCKKDGYEVKDYYEIELSDMERYNLVTLIFLTGIKDYSGLFHVMLNQLGYGYFSEIGFYHECIEQRRSLINSEIVNAQIKKYFDEKDF